MFVVIVVILEVIDLLLFRKVILLVSGLIFLVMSLVMLLVLGFMVV